MELTIKGETNEIADLMVAIQGNRNYNLKTPNFSSNTHPLTAIDEINPCRRMNISENLRRLREKAGSSQNELGRRTSLSPAMINMLEKGTRALTLATGKDIADVLGCSLYDFFSDDNEGSMKHKTASDEHCPNILKQRFDPSEPNKVWVCDFTYLRAAGRFYYLCVILDLFSRKVIAYKLSPCLNTKLAIETLDMAAANRNVSDGVIFHSDRGCQFTSEAFRKHLDLQRSLCLQMRKSVQRNVSD